MNIKFKRATLGGFKKTIIKGDIKEIDINEDLFHPDKEKIRVCFRGASTSGIIELSTKEAEELMESIKGRVHLIKDIKTFNATSK